MRQVIIQLRPVLEGNIYRCGAQATRPVPPTRAPFVGPLGRLSQDFDRVDAIHTVGRLVADADFVGLRVNHIIRILAENVGELVAIPDDHVE